MKGASTSSSSGRSEVCLHMPQALRKQLAVVPIKSPASVSLLLQPTLAPFVKQRAEEMKHAENYKLGIRPRPWQASFLEVGLSAEQIAVTHALDISCYLAKCLWSAGPCCKGACSTSGSVKLQLPVPTLKQKKHRTQKVAWPFSPAPRQPASWDGGT